MLNCHNVFPLCGHLGIIVKFGTWASRQSWASVKGLSDKFLTHVKDVDLASVSVSVPSLISLVSADLEALEMVAWFEWPLMFEQTPNFCWYKDSNFTFDGLILFGVWFQ